MNIHESGKVREQIDETGKVFEKFGLAPMNGRILALFTVSDSAELTFDEICSFFGASKSVVSNAVSYLLNSKLIDYRTYNTGRKRYFFLTDRFFIIYFNDVLSAMTELREALYKTLAGRSPGSPEVSTRMLKWLETASVFEKQLEAGLSKLKK
jgi:DNA-binding transcriptional regulator GbsR (MarR family)